MRSAEMPSDRVLACLLGYTLGDCLGAPYEFVQQPFDASDVSLTLQEGVFGHAPGEGTDDTAMAMAAAEAILSPGDRYGHSAVYMDNLKKWLATNPPDVGNQTYRAISRWPEPVEPDNAVQSNGALFPAHVCACLGMPELAPVFARRTHPSIACETAAGVLSRFVFVGLYGGKLPHLPRPWDITQAGYDPALDEAVFHTHNHKIGWCWLPVKLGHNAVTAVTNNLVTPLEVLQQVIALGGDTDTNAAITGGLLGAYFGMEAWEGFDLTQLKQYEYWKNVAEKAAVTYR